MVTSDSEGQAFRENRGHIEWKRASAHALRTLIVADNKVEVLEELAKKTVHASRTQPVVDKKVEGLKKQMRSCEKNPFKSCFKEPKYNQHCPTCRRRATQQKDAFHMLLAEDRKSNPDHELGMRNAGRLRAGNAKKELNAYFCPKQFPPWKEEVVEGQIVIVMH